MRKAGGNAPASYEVHDLAVSIMKWQQNPVTSCSAAGNARDLSCRWEREDTIQVTATQSAVTATHRRGSHEHDGIAHKGHARC